MLFLSPSSSVSVVSFAAILQLLREDAFDTKFREPWSGMKDLRVTPTIICRLRCGGQGARIFGAISWDTQLDPPTYFVFDGQACHVVYLIVWRATTAANLLYPY